MSLFCQVLNCSHVFGLNFDLEGSTAELIADTFGLNVSKGGYIGVVTDKSLDYFITSSGNPCVRLIYKTQDKTDGKIRNVGTLLFMDHKHKAYYHSCLRWEVVGGKKPYPKSIKKALSRKEELPTPTAMRFEVPNYFMANKLNMPDKLSYQLLEVAFNNKQKT